MGTEHWLTPSIITYTEQMRRHQRQQHQAGGLSGEISLHHLFIDWLRQAMAVVLVDTPERQRPLVFHEYSVATIGRPDIALARPGLAAHAFIELKNPDHSLSFRGAGVTPHDKKQFKRFANLDVYAYSNFHTLQRYTAGALQTKAAICPALCLDPGTSDQNAAKLIKAQDHKALIDMLSTLILAAPPMMRNASDVARNLARAARLIRGVVLDLLTQDADNDRAGEAGDKIAHNDDGDKTAHNDGAVDGASAGAPPISATDRGLLNYLKALRQEFYQTLYTHAVKDHDDKKGRALWDEDFADAFVQTLAYGLLLAHEGGTIGLDGHAYKQINKERHPLLYSVLRLLELDEAKALGQPLQILRTLVDNVDPTCLKTRDNGADPLLYFYEQFLESYDPELRRKHGVYYTPVDVVHYQVRAIDRLARDHLALDGVLDERMTILDPSCGTGTYLLATAGLVAAQAQAQARRGKTRMVVDAAVKDLSTRLYGLETLIGPYAVAHFRLQRRLNDMGVDMAGRLNIFLADTLAAAVDTAQVTPSLLSGEIHNERIQADKLKQQQSILAIIGNPPYRRLSAGETRHLIGDWVWDLMEDFRTPAQAAGLGGDTNNLNDFYVAFYRWALWKLFESSAVKNVPHGTSRPSIAGDDPSKSTKHPNQSHPGRILSFITNRSFLCGGASCGLRQMLRQHFDRIEIVDLRGDNRGAKPAGIIIDDNVFDIQVGVCILTAIARPQQSGTKDDAQIYYADAWGGGHYRRQDKLNWLSSGQLDQVDPHFTRLPGQGGDPFRPIAFKGQDWPGLDSLFSDSDSGMKTHRDKLVYAVDKEALAEKIRHFYAPNGVDEGRKYFKYSAGNKAAMARKQPFDIKRIRPVTYRPLDRRWLYDSDALINRPRPKLRAIWGEDNLALHSLNNGIGAGPAVFTHGQLPDQNAFRGSNGGRVFPLYDRRDGGGSRYNLKGSLIQSLANQYGRKVDDNPGLVQAEDHLPGGIKRGDEPPDPDVIKTIALSGEEVFYYITAVLSATSYSQRYASDLENTVPRVPFTKDRSLFAYIAALGRRVASLQSFRATSLLNGNNPWHQASFSQGPLAGPGHLADHHGVDNAGVNQGSITDQGGLTIDLPSRNQVFILPINDRPPKDAPPDYIYQRQLREQQRIQTSLTARGGSGFIHADLSTPYIQPSDVLKVATPTRFRPNLPQYPKPNLYRSCPPIGLDHAG